MKRHFLLLATLLFTLNAPANAYAAEDFTLWQSETFTEPFADGVIATSVEVPNNAGLNSVKISVLYEDIEPDVCQCEIFAVIEEEITNGVWIPLGPQNTGYGVEGNSPARIITVGPRFVENPGGDLVIATPEGNTRLSVHDDVAPDKFRVRVLVQGPGLLSSVTLTAHGRKFSQ